MSDRVFEPPCEVRGEKQAYQVETFLGRGGFGESYRGRAADGSPVTLKVLRPDRLESWKAFDLFEREARALRVLDHPGVPRLVEVFAQERERVVLVSGYVPGRSLQTILDSGERLDLQRVERLARELLEILEYLHTREPPVIHRDLKPSNVVIDESGRAHLIDFGAVQTQLLAPGQAGSTMVGTLGYFPQEQLLGRAVPASDLYALGMTLLVAMTGEPPERQAHQPSTGKILPPPGVPLHLARFLWAVLEPAPGARPQTAREARALLDAPTALVERATEEVALTGGQRAQRWVFRAAFAGGCVAAATINILLFNQFSETQLVGLAPFWVAPIVFGVAGLIALPRRRALAIAVAAGSIGLGLLYLFLVGIFPSL